VWSGRNLPAFQSNIYLFIRREELEVEEQYLDYCPWSATMCPHFHFCASSPSSCPPYPCILTTALLMFVCMEQCDNHQTDVCEFLNFFNFYFIDTFWFLLNTQK
jgi:hypothetical protein